MDQGVHYVALRKESVDRNIKIMSVLSGLSTSLSARRAWIEIMLCLLFRPVVGVALRKESVDRNAVTETIEVEKLGRSPQGERG